MAKRKAKSNKIPHAKKEAFLRAYAVSGVIGKAAGAAGIDRSTHYDWLHTDSEYAAKFEQAKLAYVEKLEEEADRRAHDGVDEPVYQQGALVGHKRRYSDTLLIFRLKALAPEKYRERYEVKTDDSDIDKEIKKQLAILAGRSQKEDAGEAPGDESLE